MKTLYSVITALLVVIPFSLASGKDPVPGPDRQKAQLNKEIRAYVTGEVIPVMQRARNALNSSLSDQEQKQLKEIRRTLRQIRNEAGDLVLDAGMNNKGEMALRKLHEFTERSNRQFREVKGIVHVHEDGIDQLFSRLDSNREQWAKDLHAIHRKYAPPLPGNRQAPMPGYLSEFFNPVLFTLWDGDKSFRPSINFEPKGDARGPVHDRRGDMMKEIREYSERNIRPVVREERLDFDSRLSEQEKSVIDSVRNELRVWHQKHAELMKKHNDQKIQQIRRIRNNENLPDSVKRMMHEKMQQKDSIFRARSEAQVRRIMKDLRPVAQVHKEEIKTHVDSIMLNRKDWNRDLNRIMAKYLPGDLDSLKRKEIRKAVRAQVYRFREPVNFLLVPVREIVPEETVNESKTKDESLVTGISSESWNRDISFSLAPNPAAGEFRVMIGVPQEEEASISVYAANGSVSQVLMKSRLMAGEHAREFSTAGYPNGVYFVRLQAGNLVRVQKLLIQN